MANTEEEKLQAELANKFMKHMENIKNEAKKSLSDEEKEFVKVLHCSWRITEDTHPYISEMTDGFKSGKYQKPSEFFLKKCGHILDCVIFKKHRDAFLYSVDSVNRWLCPRDITRRSFRTADYSCYLQRLAEIFGSFEKLMWLDTDICDILSGKVSEEIAVHLKQYSDSYNNTISTYVYTNQSMCYNAEIIAYELDKGNSRLEEILTDIIMGEGGSAVNYEIIRGILYSKNAKMHELLGKLLLAASQQEGLRQAICESADEGTVEGFKVILKVITENNLIRFSSVKRAVGTWTGIVSDESSSLERISEKTLKLICECVEDENTREKYLSSEDSMEIYISLWSYALFEMKTAAEKVKELSKNGTHHQLLTAGYFAENLEDVLNCNDIAKAVIFEHSEPDILALYLPHFLKNWTGGYSVYYYIDRAEVIENEKSRSLTLKKYFDSKEEAEKMYDRLWEIYKTIPKKSIEFSPCIFPWYSASLEKSDIAEKLCLTAYLLKDDKKFDECCKLFKEVNVYDRAILLTVTMNPPRTDIQKAALTEALSDKSGNVREFAYKLIKKISLDEDNYLKLEDMLKYKASDVRENIISLLLDREDDKVCKTVGRLLSDKKEEKRTAALDMVMQLSKNEKKRIGFEKCLPFVKDIKYPSAKERILIENILGSEKKDDEKAPLFDETDKYSPEIPDNEYTRECVKTFMRYFPDSKAGSLIYPDIYKKPSLIKSLTTCKSAKETEKNTASLFELVYAHRTDEFIIRGESFTIDCWDNIFYVEDKDGNETVPFTPLWRKWLTENKITPEMLVRMLVMLSAAIKRGDVTDNYINESEKYIIELFGSGFEKYHKYDYLSKMGKIIKQLIDENVPAGDKTKMSVAAQLWYLKAVPDKDVLIEEKYVTGRTNFAHLIAHNQIGCVLQKSFNRCCENSAERFALDHITEERSFNDERFDKKKAERGILEYPYGSGVGYSSHKRFESLHMGDYIFAAYNKIITERQMYYQFFKNTSALGYALGTLSQTAKFIREADRQVTARGDASWRGNRFGNVIALVWGSFRESEKNLNEEEMKLVKYAEGLYEKVIDEVLSVELKRGDLPTKYSEAVGGISRIYGTHKFTAILSALGNDTLERSTYYYGTDKRRCLSHLLSVCIPSDTDNAEKLREKLKGTDITEKRLIEAAMYSPEWMPIVEEYLGWEGFSSACYYFIAHMNESFDDKRKAVIAKYTPLTEEELNAGAFDIKWFRSAYETLGQERFDMIYNAAKYISDGAKHSRARKYADAALGKMTVEETEKTISDKRNKDLLMAYPLIPIKDEDDICRRYLYLQKFLKESKKFGSQRSASEKKAVETAMQNLSINAGYADVTRLTLRMETKLIDDSRELFEEKEIEGTIFRLSVDASGKAEIICTKGGKTLKSVPAKLKKNEYIVRLTDTKKKLTEQYRRTKVMFEQAMEESTEFTVAELNILRNNPVALPVIKDLVFACGEKLGFLSGNELKDCSGNIVHLSDEDKVITAHPYTLYKSGHWADYQKIIFDDHLVQPFRQVFRELYVKTAEESEAEHSLRYSGNQIQPAKAAACLKTRRWVADVEDGLQKVYYKENIVARIYAMADWFTPADIEAPTLEWVEFSDRKTGKPLMIKDIPDIIFSEVMRDVDLAVSVAHAGGVDPETSHSTIEMRAALIGFTLPLFKLTNVELKGNHAHISGKYGEYTLHLGSGVIHKQGGTMINILPVHSQHRGKLFLPFADDDPKTAEIITKVLFLAEDSKIKDPSILEQLK